MSWKHYERSSNLLLTYIHKLIHYNKEKMWHLTPTKKDSLTKEVKISFKPNTSTYRNGSEVESRELKQTKKKQK